MSCVQELFDKEIASQENAQFSVCQAEKTGAKMALLENQQDIKVSQRTAIYWQVNVLVQSLFVLVCHSWCQPVELLRVTTYRKLHIACQIAKSCQPSFSRNNDTSLVSLQPHPKLRSVTLWAFSSRKMCCQPSTIVSAHFHTLLLMVTTWHYSGHWSITVTYLGWEFHSQLLSGLTQHGVNFVHFYARKSRLEFAPTTTLATFLADPGNGDGVLYLENFCLAVTSLQFPIDICFSATVDHHPIICWVRFPPVTLSFDLWLSPSNLQTCHNVKKKCEPLCQIPRLKII